MHYDFDEIIDRRGTHALNTDGFRDYIFHAPPSMEFPFADDDFVRMWLADMEFATAPEILEAVKARLDRRILGYTKLFDTEYQDVFLRWAQRHYDWTFRTEHLVTSPGVIPALYDLVGHLCGPGDRVLVTTPSYAFFKHAADHNGVDLVTSSLREKGGRYTLDFDDLERKARDERTKLCIFCNPHNPTGRVWTPEELKRLGDVCLDNGLWVVSDEIHCDLLRQGRTHTPLARVHPGADRIVTCIAPSKTFNLAGLMFANVIIPNDGLRALWKRRHLGFENPLSVAAAKAAYTHGDAWLRQLRTYLDGNFAFTGNYLERHLPRAGFRIPEATYLAWVNVGAYLPRGTDLPAFFAHRAGVLLEGGDMFVADADAHIRLNLACPRAVLEKGLGRICAALRE
jgi:cystathionine beta-lyase